jgi:hypothetical protein
MNTKSIHRGHNTIPSDDSLGVVAFGHYESSVFILAVPITNSNDRARRIAYPPIAHGQISISSRGSQPDHPVVNEPTKVQDRRERWPGPKKDGILLNTVKRGPCSLMRPLVRDEADPLNSMVTWSPLLKGKFFINLFHYPIGTFFV